MKTKKKIKIKNLYYFKIIKVVLVLTHTMMLYFLAGPLPFVVFTTLTGSGSGSGS
jgi:hypothetical protein